ncbi:hypothetical protein QEN41_21050 [Gordonia alkanivorans]|uniref:hypothetical protein n=1 Tax=Gordonia alkanivorans TaxID=84096 RepID=UPI002448F967|nr:hypothetical protein [Gordonia alkanivorans]MDH3022467.1 hypothetical protein [Gordonia alkanivorans]
MAELYPGYQLFPCLTILVGVLGWVGGTGLRRVSVLSPYSFGLLILVSVFGVRPLLMARDDSSFEFYGYRITASEFEYATFLGFLAVVGLTMGFIAGRFFGRTQMDRSQLNGSCPPDSFRPGSVAKSIEVDPGRSFAAAWLLILGWFAVMVFVGGGLGFVSQLFGGRSPEVTAKLSNVPAIVFALPVVAALVIAVTRFRHERSTRYSRAQLLHYWLLAAVTVIPPSALGTRRFLIPSVVIAVLGSLSGKLQLRVPLSWGVLGIGSFLVLTIFPFVRSAGSRSPDQAGLVGAMQSYFVDEGVSGSLENYFVSFDTEMFNYVAFLSSRLGRDIPYGLGQGTFGEIIAMPIPAALSPLDIWNDVMLTSAFGSGCSIETACPVPSVVGVLFSDFWIPGVLVGIVAIGYLASKFDRSLEISRYPEATAALLLAAGFAVVFFRGNSMAQFWYGFQIFVVWFLVTRALAGLNAGSTSERFSLLHRGKVPL